jgi:TolB protein
MALTWLAAEDLMTELLLLTENARQTRRGLPHFLLATTLLLVTAGLCHAQEPVGIFENHSDMGTVLHPGTASFDGAKKTYTVTGSGENMWSTADAFQFVWKKMSGDVEISADVSFLNQGGNEHKKAVLILRQSLDADSVYADIALHGNGLIALQYRDEKGAATHEIKSAVSTMPAITTTSAAEKAKLSPRFSAPMKFRIMRRGSDVYMSVGNSGETAHYDGESIRVPLGGELYVGIGVCAHDKRAIEQATFSSVELKALAPSTGQPVLYSTLETIAVDSTDRQVAYFASGRFEAPNWARDGSYLLFNRAGHLEKLLLFEREPEVLNTGFADHINNDHGISPDATQIVISDNSQEIA